MFLSTLPPQHHRDGARGCLLGHHASGGGGRRVAALRRGTVDWHLRPCPQAALLHPTAQRNAGRRWGEGEAEIHRQETQRAGTNWIMVMEEKTSNQMGQNWHFDASLSIFIFLKMCKTNEKSWKTSALEKNLKQKFYKTMKFFIFLLSGFFYILKLAILKRRTFWGNKLVLSSID